MPTPQQWCQLLLCAEMEILGKMPWSSNATYLVELTDGALSSRGIYKPGRGERPLWDFPGGLFRREVAAYELGRAVGVAVVPETVLREDAPLGVGSVQRFIDARFEEHYFTMLESGNYQEQLMTIAGFDLLANNADRKGGHLLIDAVDRIWAIDNGLCFHIEDKLRTVMWDFAGERIPELVLDAARLLASEVPQVITALLEEDEILALVERAEFYLSAGIFPYPPDDHRAYPWPLV
jgi:uncharacterized repeat protein (TIGR03843 family)